MTVVDNIVLIDRLKEHFTAREFAGSYITPAGSSADSHRDDNVLIKKSPHS